MRSSQIMRGKARRVVKPGQVFNRIHVADIAQAIDAAFARAAVGIFNVADDEPTLPAIRSSSPRNSSAAIRRRKSHSTKLPPSMSPMALSFWQECRRVSNDKLKRELGVTLRYPTYREGYVHCSRRVDLHLSPRAGEVERSEGEGASPQIAVGWSEDVLNILRRSDSLRRPPSAFSPRAGRRSARRER